MSLTKPIVKCARVRVPWNTNPYSPPPPRLSAFCGHGVPKMRVFSNASRARVDTKYQRRRSPAYIAYTLTLLKLAICLLIPLIVPRPSSTRVMPYTTADFAPDILHNPNSCSRSSTKWLRTGVPFHSTNPASDLNIHRAGGGNNRLTESVLSRSSHVYSSYIRNAGRKDSSNRGTQSTQKHASPPPHRPTTRNPRGPVILARLMTSSLQSTKNKYSALSKYRQQRHGTCPRAIRAAGATANHRHDPQRDTDPTNAPYRL